MKHILLACSLGLALGCATTRPLLPPSPMTQLNPEEEELRGPSRIASQSVSTSVPVDTSLGEWRALGPRNYGGKVYDVAVDPTNKNIVYAAYASGGGLWKTIDGGTTWTQVTDTAKYNSVSSVAIAKSNANTIIAGLGSPPGPVNQANGLIRSTDGGSTWTSIGPTDSGNYARIVIDPNDANIIYTATETKLYKTINGGSSWSTLKTYTGTSTTWNDLPELVMHPTTSSTLLFAQKSVGLYRTTDSGANWTSLTPTSHLDWTVMAYAPSNPSIVYCERPTGTNKDVQTYQSSDGGSTWTPKALLTESIMQGRFDSTIDVDPLDPTHVFIGNSSYYESFDSLSTVNIYYNDSGTPHADIGRIVSAPSDSNTMYAGTDGGLWKSSDNGATWARCDTGVNTTIVYGFDVDATGGRVIVSPQDYSNGIGLYGDHTSWMQLTGSEYWDYEISPLDPKIWFMAYRPMYRTTDAGNSITNVDPDSTLDRPRRFPFVFDATDPNTVYCTAKKIYKSTNLGTTWTVISPSVFDSMTYWVDWLDINASNDNVMYASFTGGLYVTTDGGTTWNMKNGQRVKFASVPSQPDKLWALRSTVAVEYCTSYGASCTDVTNNLNGLTFNDIRVDPGNESRIFVATKEGVFFTTNGGTSWSRLGANLPRINIVKLRTFSHHLYAGGAQGVWEFSFNASNSPVISSFSITPSSQTAPYAASAMSWLSYSGDPSVDNGIGSLPSFGTATIHPESSATYTMSNTNGTTTVTSDASVAVDTSSLVTKLTSDFPTSASGSWAFEEFTTSSGATTAMTYGGSVTSTIDSASVTGPKWSSASGTALVMKDNTRGLIVMNPPNSTTNQTSATYTFASSGTYRLTGGFARFNSLRFGNGAAVSIVKNTTTASPLFSATINQWQGSDSSNPFAPELFNPQWFDVNVTVSAGDKVRFLVSENGAYLSDSTALLVAITNVSLAAPANVTATPASDTSVTVAWDPVNGATGYQVLRTSNISNTYSLVQQTAGTLVGAQLTYTDTTVTTGEAYLYKIVAYNATTTGSPSTADATVVKTFASDPIAAGSTTVKGSHITDLRTAINKLRGMGNIGDYSFTDTTLTGVAIKAVHITQLRSALDEARAALDLAPLGYENTITANSSVIKALDVTELRTDVQ